MNLYRKLCPCHEPIPKGEPLLRQLLERLGLPEQGLNETVSPSTSALGQTTTIFNTSEAQKRIREACASRRAARTWLLALISALAALASALAAWYAVVAK
jgi:hypothetical protein